MRYSPRDILPVAVVNLIEGIPGITDIAKLGKLAAFLQCHIPALGGFIGQDLIVPYLINQFLMDSYLILLYLIGRVLPVQA